MAEKQPQPSSETITVGNLEAGRVPEGVVSGTPGHYCERIGAICFSGACASQCLEEQIDAAKEALHR